MPKKKTIEIMQEPKEKPGPLDLSDVEMIFGTPNIRSGISSPSSGKQDMHLIANEKKQTNKHMQPQLNNTNSESDTEAVPSQPLLEPDRGRQKPPLAGPEVDDLDDEKTKTVDTTPYPGIDDGLLDPQEKKPGELDSDSEDKKSNNGHGIGNGVDHHFDSEDGNWSHGEDDPDGPNDGINGLSPRFGVDNRPVSPMIPGSIPDVNTYQQKKNLAQGMMDLALLSANANQLRYVLESSHSHPYYYSSLVFISLSIIFQVAVGIGLIMNSRYDVKDEKDICKADKINNMTVLGVFLITIVNVFITSFSVATQSTVVVQQGG